MEGPYDIKCPIQKNYSSAGNDCIFEYKKEILFLSAFGVKFRYSEKGTKICINLPTLVDITLVVSSIFFWCNLRIYELYNGFSISALKQTLFKSWKQFLDDYICRTLYEAALCTPRATLLLALSSFALFQLTENITEYEKQVPPNKFLVVSGNSGNCINLYNMWL